jgi:hypothetical protein
MLEKEDSMLWPERKPLSERNPEVLPPLSRRLLNLVIWLGIVFVVLPLAALLVNSLIR